jgi:single-strand DNA-binding protein
MSQEVTGKLKVVMDEQEFSSGFKKREFVITTDEKYPQDIKFELIKDKCDDIVKFNIGQSVKVSYNLRGNYYEPKDAYYNSLQAWRLELDGEQASQTPAPQTLGIEPPEDDLPF